MENTCFVCLESTHPLLENICNCTLKVHPKCQMQLLKKTSTHKTQCAVCRTTYKNIKYIHLPNMTYAHGMFYTVVGGYITMFYFSIKEFVKYLNERNTYTLYLFIFASTTFVFHVLIPVFFVTNFKLLFPCIIKFDIESFTCSTNSDIVQII